MQLLVSGTQVWFDGGLVKTPTESTETGTNACWQPRFPKKHKICCFTFYPNRKYDYPIQLYVSTLHHISNPLTWLHHYPRRRSSAPPPFPAALCSSDRPAGSAGSARVVGSPADCWEQGFPGRMWGQTEAEEEEDNQDEGKCPASGTFSPNPCEYFALVGENRTTKFRDKRPVIIWLCTFYFTYLRWWAKFC